MIDIDYLREILHFDPSTGVFTWAKPRPKIRVGERAGHNHHKGYRRIDVCGKSYAEHRLAWFYYYGVWPADQIDHINRVRDDNRISNLREASNGENRANAKSASKHGVKGVAFHSWLKERPWEARIQLKKDGRRTCKSLGCFPTKEEAHARYTAAMAERYPKHFSP